MDVCILNSMRRFNLKNRFSGSYCLSFKNLYINLVPPRELLDGGSHSDNREEDAGSSVRDLDNIKPVAVAAVVP